MDKLRSFSRQSFFVIAFVFLLFVGAMDVFIFYGLKLIVQPPYTLSKHFFQCFLPSTVVLWLLFTLVCWLLVRSVSKKKFGTEEAVTSGDNASEAALLKLQENKNKRFFLHLISALQRDARLIDFFFEKLDQFEDAQIGAAVRNIHENSFATLQKYLTPVPVLDSAEGEEITIEKGFDPTMIKLTGNVAGEPPFKGILRHKGWQAGELELPTLSDRENSGLISPAEVEVK